MGPLRKLLKHLITFQPKNYHWIKKLIPIDQINHSLLLLKGKKWFHIGISGIFSKELAKEDTMRAMIIYD